MAGPGRPRGRRRRAVRPRFLAARLVGESGWPTLYGKTDPRTDHPIQNGPPADGLRTREPLSSRRVAVDGRRVYVEAKMVEDPSPRGGALESTPTQLVITPPLRWLLGRALTLRGTAGSLQRTGGHCGRWASPVLPSPCSSDARKGAYPSGYRREPSSGWACVDFGPPVSSSSLPGRLSLCDRWRVGLAACVAPAPGTGACRPPQSRCGPPPSGLHWLNHARGWPPPRAGVTEARGPLCPRHRWSLWIVGRWPVSIPRFPGGAAPWDPPFVGVVHGVRTPLLRAVCRSPPAPVRAFPRRDPLRADRCPRGFQWGQLDGHRLRSPGAPGRRRRGRALVSPLPA